MASLNGFEQWRRGAPPVGLTGATASGTMEYWRRGAPLRVLASGAAGGLVTALARVRVYFSG